MPCKQMQGQLALYAGRELDPAQSLLVEAHLTRCPSCREGAAAYERTRSLLSHYGRVLGASDPAAVWRSLDPPASAGGAEVERVPPR